MCVSCVCVCHVCVCNLYMYIPFYSSQVRHLNLYHEGDVTPYGCVLTECRVNRCWSELKERCRFDDRKAGIEAFNKLVHAYVHVCTCASVHVCMCACVCLIWCHALYPTLATPYARSIGSGQGYNAHAYMWDVGCRNWDVGGGSWGGRASWTCYILNTLACMCTCTYVCACMYYYCINAHCHAHCRANKWLKRGVAMVPTKYGIAFGLKYLNQAGALLHVYTDGSVLLTHGGIEIGQGLHTKMIQVCAHCLGVPVEKVHIMDTSTTTVANSSPTAASASTDLYGMAVKVTRG